MLIPRTIEETVRNISSTFPVLLLTGPRQVGKTTLLESILEPGRKKVSLDNMTARSLAKEDPELFLQRYAPPVMIDEIQYAPELLPYIKILVDERKQCGDFWLTGSQMFRMMKDVSETLAGRVGIIPMQGLSNSEIQGNHFHAFSVNPSELMDRMAVASPMGLMDIFDRIYRGSMPRLYEIDSINTDIYFESYIDTYLSRDIRDLRQVGDLTAFLKFIKIIAARTATNVNYEAIAGEAGISAPTAKQWLSILVSSGLVILIEPYSNNVLKRVVKAPRMYFMDTGLCAHLMGWSSGTVLEGSAMSGAFFETWVVGEIYKSYLNTGKRPPMYFYRDSNKKEIDIILYQDGILNPIEVKKNSAPKDAVRNFSVLKPLEKASNEENVFLNTGQLKAEVGTGAVICMAKDILPVDRKNWYIPAWLI
ncbi:MAG: ATP-binding protein [Parasporobacterium sp.]|nr:ATP-binding protein [Parasporobacterium sp.]